MTPPSPTLASTSASPRTNLAEKAPATRTVPTAADPIGRSPSVSPLPGRSDGRSVPRLDGPLRDLRLAAWVRRLGSPTPESPAAKLAARCGGLVAVLALLGYLLWRATATLPVAGPWRVAGLVLIGFEALPVLGSVTKLVTWWSVDAPAPAPVTQAPGGQRVAVLIPTYNEPPEVVGPTVVAARDLEPVHETWVLDDGDRAWLAELCADLGVRYVTRSEHEHAKAGNLNHALALMAREEADGAEAVDLVAVLDCDHVPLPAFLTATLGHFEDPDLALVQAPQTYFNGGAFDDDGFTGEQGLFFNVQLAARQAAGAGPFWCGSTSVLRVRALREVGGVAQETLIEDMHTTLKLQRLGWRTAYHHQTVALGLAPATAEQYLIQRRRWGMGAMQVLVRERLWRRHRWLSLRSQYEYLTGTLWWLEGLATLMSFLIPVSLLVTGARVSTAAPVPFALVFLLTFSLRLWGQKRLMRREIRWGTAFALRILRVPIGLSCLWWLVSRRSLAFKVTPKGADDARRRGRVPGIVAVLIGSALVLTGYAALGLLHVLPWSAPLASTETSGAWLLVATVVLILTWRRIVTERHASSRRTAHRFPARVDVLVNGRPAQLVDVSVSGAAIRFVADDLAVDGPVTVEIPGAGELRMDLTRGVHRDGDSFAATVRIPAFDWSGMAILSRWMFHTPAGCVPGLPDGVPVVALERRR